MCRLGNEAFTLLVIMHERHDRCGKGLGVGRRDE
jgi:hypothetical protein